MPHDFPHIGNDSYPHLDNAHPFARTVPFDYGRYDYTATIKLCNVSWGMDYKHVVNWQSAEARDSYFHKLSGHVVDLSNGFTRTQTDSVRVNVPYDVALTFNYVFMEVPQLTQDQPINHEASDGVRVICAWIQEAIYAAPSTTELVISVDYWTTYLPHLSQAVTLMLHRGHAPAYAITTDAYLANPRANNAHLLTPDVNFGVPDVVATSRLIDIANGAKYILLASTIPYQQIEGLTLSGVESGSGSPASYYDIATRMGHQLGVNDYEWHYGGYSYQGMRNPTDYQSTGHAVPTYTYVYAIRASVANTALKTLSQRLPQFIKSIRGAFILPARAVDLSTTSYTIAGVTLYRVHTEPKMHDLASLKLTKSDFAYPTRYEDIAKLYTSPYAHLVVSDALGHDVEVRVEDMGSNPRVIEQICPMMECLRWDLILSDVNSSGNLSYSWINLDGESESLQIPGADLGRYTLSLGIPTYALYLDGRTLSSMDGYSDAMTRRQRAVAAYQNGMRSLNTAKENADDSASAAKANADASADTNVTNTANNGSNAEANAVVQNNARTSSTTRNNQAQTALTNDAVQGIYDQSNADLEYTMFATDANLKSEAVSAIQNLVGNGIAGNAVGAINAGVSGIVNITTNAALSQLSMQNIEDHQAITQGHTRTTNSIHIANASDQTSYTNAANTQQTANNANTANTNAANSAATAKANATRTMSVTQANAGYTRTAGETNAKVSLELERAAYLRQGQAHDLDNPASFGEVSGDHAPDALRRRLCQVRIETQSASAIGRAGDAMLRYGYIYDGIWSVPTSLWCPKEHDGCYWEAADVTLNGALVGNANAANVFENILTAGVTVWNDPAKIGGIPW